MTPDPFVSGMVSDSDGIHLGDSSRDKSHALELSKPMSRSAAGFGNGSLSKQWICDYLSGDDFDQGNNPMETSVLDHIHLGLTGMHMCTAMNSLLSSMFES